MKKFVKRPVVVDAIHFNGGNMAECKKVIGDAYDNTLNYPNIVTLEGTMRVDVGDYIIKGVKGVLYPCKPDIFKLTYESAPENVTAHNTTQAGPPAPEQGTPKPCDCPGDTSIAWGPDNNKCTCCGITWAV